MSYEAPQHGYGETSESPPLPDVSRSSRPQVSGRLNWVGMSDVAQPIKVKVGSEVLTIPALVSVGVSLVNPKARGIHMSRLFLKTQDFLSSESVEWSKLGRLMLELIEGQEGLSNSGSLRIKWNLPLRRSALLSDQSGWRQYPVEMAVRLENGEVRYQMGLEILYSSTCPCSAALARQLVQDQFSDAFKDQKQISFKKVHDWLSEESAMAGTPHAQRSLARVRLEFAEGLLEPSFPQLIDQLEEALQTPVQTAVKRIDEQEFARRNAQNLMFCEDAARRVSDALIGLGELSNWWCRVEHQESLHAHNAVAEVMKDPQSPISWY